MSPYEIKRTEDGWYEVYRGNHLVEEFLTEEEAENAIEGWELEDEEAQREAYEEDHNDEC